MVHIKKILNRVFISMYDKIHYKLKNNNNKKKKEKRNLKQMNKKKQESLWVSKLEI